MKMKMKMKREIKSAQTKGPSGVKGFSQAPQYNSTTAEFIPVKNRIGILDRKLEVSNENVDYNRDWLKAA